ncbi:hypothetical protein A2U01_0016038 [Trifolium medium]|uniref:Uncharacterized protein n=1 Tax=Trifolium medium TaxID=97028 RepID=A0A392N7E2_9FABA|nr:hypothetical protein [Trifolium medium]
MGALRTWTKNNSIYDKGLVAHEHEAAKSHNVQEIQLRAGHLASRSDHEPTTIQNALVLLAWFLAQMTMGRPKCQNVLDLLA